MKNSDFIAERTSNTKVGLVNLLRRYDKPRMNGRVRSVNVLLDGALMSRDMSHINVNDTGTSVREEYTTHGLHLNYRGNMRLSLLTVESIRCGHVPNRNSSILIITHAKAPHF
jgi:hypothetical protein